MAQQQQHSIGLTEFLIFAVKVYRERDRTVQLLISFDRSKNFDESPDTPDANCFHAEDFHRTPESSADFRQPASPEPSC